MTSHHEGSFGGLTPSQGVNGDVDYVLDIGGAQLPLRGLLGRELRFESLGGILCVHCGSESALSFGGGYCAACQQRLPQCDQCFRSPERCHHHLGTCRDPAWGERICMAPHLLYLAETSALKIGITRPERMTTRWLEQGAVQARPWLGVRSRRIAGEIEAVVRTQISDRTNWRQMLRAEPPRETLEAAGRECLRVHARALADLLARFGADAWQAFPDAATWSAHYPMPAAGAPNLKQFRLLTRAAEAQGRLLGAKGRYLVFDSGVLNTGSHSGALLRLQLDAPALRPRQSDLFG